MISRRRFARRKSRWSGPPVPWVGARIGYGGSCAGAGSTPAAGSTRRTHQWTHPAPSPPQTPNPAPAPSRCGVCVSIQMGHRGLEPRTSRLSAPSTSVTDSDIGRHRCRSMSANVRAPVADAVRCRNRYQAEVGMNRHTNGHARAPPMRVAPSPSSISPQRQHRSLCLRALMPGTRVSVQMQAPAHLDHGPNDPVVDRIRKPAKQKAPQIEMNCRPRFAELREKRERNGQLVSELLT